MKKLFILLLAVTIMFSLAACGGSNKPNDTQPSSSAEPSSSASDDTQPSPSANTAAAYDAHALDSMLDAMASEYTSVEQFLTDESSSVLGKIGDTYEDYNENKSAVPDFYSSSLLKATDLYEYISIISIDYFKCVAEQGLDDYDTWDDAMEDFYDAWNDGMDDIYDAWDGIYDDIYKKCDELIDEAPDSLDYSERSDVWSDMYNSHTDAWSAMYEAHTDAWSDTYSDYTEVWSGFYSDNSNVDDILHAAENNSEPDGSASQNEPSNTPSPDSPLPTSSSLGELEQAASDDVDGTISVLSSEWDDLSTRIDSYEKYLESVDEIEAFYGRILNETTLLCIRMREHSLGYAEAILTSDKSNDDKYDDLENIYDSIYEDAGDDIYDEIYDGILDEMYDVFYDGVIDDAYDTVPYSEWSDVHSDEYEWWSDTRSDVYEEWSDFRSEVYEFWSDLRSEVWNDDLGKAQEVVSDFREDIEELGGGGQPNTTGNTTGTDAQSIEPSTAPSGELVDGMRSDFKEAMDSYEAFYDEYCDFMEEYKENPSDTELLTEYGQMIIKLADMNEKFEAWENEDLNDVELRYYLEVNNRITQRLLDVAA